MTHPALEIASANRACEEAAAEFRTAVAAGTAGRPEMSRLKQQYPWNGVLPCQAAGLDFVLMHAHDDVVAWEYLWWGDDGYEREIVETWVEWSRQTDRVFDIGAYTGLMSVLSALANPEAQVELFEPLDRLGDRARVNLRLNGVLDRVSIHPVAASDERGRTQINLYRHSAFLGTGSAIDEKPGKNVVSKVGIRRVVLDQRFPKMKPGLVKIDVEGHELAVLRGAEQLIARGRPKMIVEVWPATRDEVLGLLDSWGYVSTPFGDDSVGVVNYACVPREA